MKTEIKRVAPGGPISITAFNTKELNVLSALARKGVFEMCLSADHGHIGGSSAATELFVALYFGGVLRFNPSDPDETRRDRVLVRGHLGPIRYKLFSWLGWLDESELSTYRRIGSRLHGHEDHLETPGVDISPSGSLGMLLSYGVGAALAVRDTQEDSLTFVFLGDGEEQEGVVSEAARHAAHLKLGKLVAVIDRNMKQLSNPVEDVDTSNLTKIWEGYGWHVIHLSDGHDIEMVLEAYNAALLHSKVIGQPALIIADTIKGIGVEGAEEHFSGFHTMSRVKRETVQDAVASIELALDKDAVTAVLEKMKVLSDVQRESQKPNIWLPTPLNITPSAKTPNHPDECQADYFSELGRLMDETGLKREEMYFLTADVTTKDTVTGLGLSELFRFHNVGIREQHMVAMAHGISVVRPESRVLINSFDAFTYRGMDQMNAALQGHGHMVIIGDVAGITNSRNGKTHQTVGQPAALLAMEGLTFLEPWDATDTFACLNYALGEGRRIVYIRVHSSAVRNQVSKEVKRTLTYYTVRETSSSPDLVLVGAGLTVDSCIEASELLQQEGIETRVVNVLNPNSLDEEFGKLVVEGKPLLSVYNGNPRVLRQSLADAILQGDARPSLMKGLGFSIGNTGTMAEMLEWTKLDGNSVRDAAKRLL